jgi:hypothetical protein
MKSEIDEILFEFSKYVIENYDLYKVNVGKEYIRKSIAKELTKSQEYYLVKVLSLIENKLDECKPDIQQYLAKKFDVCHSDWTQDIINIIKNKTGVKK